MTDKNIFLSLYDSLILYQQKVCFMPVKLIKSLKLKVGDIIRIKASENIEILCEIVPVFSSYSYFGHQILASDDVILNKLELTDLKYDQGFKISSRDIVRMSLFKIKQVDIVIVFFTVESVLRAKKYSRQFETYVRNLISMYKIQMKCIIKCSRNDYAKRLGISYIIIKSVSGVSNEGDSLDYAGELVAESSIKIIKLDCVERNLFKIKKPVTLGGLNDVLEYLKSLVNRHNEIESALYENSTSSPPSVLLIGPPGCGKTSIVRQLCAETEACLIATSGAELLSPYEGETQLNLSKIAKRACLLSEEGACIFFIDEIDSICSVRNSQSSIPEVQLISQLLLTIDECQKYPNLLLIAATNRPYALDPCARRAGRLETEILLNIPNEAERGNILEILSSELGLLPHLQSSISAIAKATPGFVGADLKALCDKVYDEIGKESHFDNFKDVSDIMLRLAETITPSIHKSLSFITSKPKETSIGGLMEIKQKLKHIFNQHCLNQELLRKLKMKQTKGILLYGPRGCGKTRLVSTLASQKGLTFISANASHLLSPYVGDSEKRIAALFHSARLAQPSILFIDEIDGIFGSRESEDRGGIHMNLLTELLQAMDGADIGTMSLQGAMKIGNQIKNIKEGVLVCAATNHPQKLDSALLRPGRFDYLIYVPPPDKEARMDILKIKTSKLDVEDVDNTLNLVSTETSGWTGAELETLISRVAMTSVLRNTDMTNSKKIFIPKALLIDEMRNFSPSLKEKDLKEFKAFQLRIENK